MIAARSSTRGRLLERGFSVGPAPRSEEREASQPVFPSRINATRRVPFTLRLFVFVLLLSPLDRSTRSRRRRSWSTALGSLPMPTSSLTLRPAPLHTSALLRSAPLANAASVPFYLDAGLPPDFFDLLGARGEMKRSQQGMEQAQSKDSSAKTLPTCLARRKLR